MSYFGELKKVVSSGRLLITHVFAPSRTMSTAIHIALTEEGDGQILEPFSDRRRRSFDDACKLILDRFNQLDKRRGPVGLIIKDIARYVSEDEWYKYKNLIKNCVFCIREPTQHLASLITRRVNEFDSNKVKYPESIKHLNELSEKDWQDKSWERINYFFDDITNQKLSIKVSILSSLGVKFCPAGSMKSLSDRFGWKPFNEKLVGGWKKAVGSSVYSPPYLGQDPSVYKERFLKNYWITEAIQSTSFKPLDPARDGPKEINELPKVVKKFLLQEIFPIYAKFVSSKYNDSRPPFNLLTQKDSLLGKINPIETFVLVSTYQNLGPEERQRQTELRDSTGKLLQRKLPIIYSTLKKLVKNVD